LNIIHIFISFIYISQIKYLDMFSTQDIIQDNTLCEKSWWT